MKTILKEQTSLKYGKMMQLNKINYIFQIYEITGYSYTYSLTHYLCKSSKPVLARHLLNRNTEFAGESSVSLKIMGWKLLLHLGFDLQFKNFPIITPYHQFFVALFNTSFSSLENLGITAMNLKDLGFQNA